MQLASIQVEDGIQTVRDDAPGRFVDCAQEGPGAWREENNMELRQHGQEVEGPREGQPEFSLSPADGGKDAWLFLAAAFFIEALIWGFPFSFGVFQEYYSSHEPFASEPFGIAAIGTTALGTMYFGSGASFVALQWWPAFRRRSAGIGLAILALGLVTSSFADRVWQLILTQGALYAVGGILLYSSVVLLIDEWFVRKKGIAFGVMWAGTGFSGISVPYIFSWGLSQFSFRTMLRAWALAVVVLCAPLLYYVKPRIPISQASSVRRFNLDFVLSRKFLFLELGNILEGLGYFVPSIYLPTYARSLGLSSAATAATVAVLNGAAVFGCVFIGILVDRFHVTTVIFINTVGAVVSVLVFWGLATSVPLLLIFSAAYGFFAGSYSSSWTGIIKEVKRDHDSANTGIIFSFLAAGRGIGSIACGPLSEALLKGRAWKGDAALGYGTGYGGLIVYTGVTALLGGLTFGVRRLGLF